jgi:hypothetical protein
VAKRLWPLKWSRGLQIGTGGRGHEGFKAEGDVSAEMVKLAYRKKLLARSEGSEGSPGDVTLLPKWLSDRNCGPGLRRLPSGKWPRGCGR